MIVGVKCRNEKHIVEYVPVFVIEDILAILKTFETFASFVLLFDS